MSNSFERYAAMNVPRRKKSVRVVKSEADAPMKPTAVEKERSDNDIQFARYKCAVRQQSEVLLNSEHGENYRVLLSLLKRLTPQSAHSAHQLVAYVRAAQWIKRCNADQKFTVLSIIDATIIRARVREGLPPFDDPLPGQPDNLYLTIRNIIGE
jgi:hypothetical protein